jgi:transcriptional regulator with XRE-family HTH domain
MTSQDDNRALTRTIGKRMREIRKSQGLPQHELSRRTGVTQNLIYDYEAGNVRMHAALFARVARALDGSADELLGLREIEPRTPPPRVLSRNVQRRAEIIGVIEGQTICRMRWSGGPTKDCPRCICGIVSRQGSRQGSRQKEIEGNRDERNRDTHSIGAKSPSPIELVGFRSLRCPAVTSDLSPWPSRWGLQPTGTHSPAGKPAGVWCRGVGAVAGRTYSPAG